MTSLLQIAGESASAEVLEAECSLTCPWNGTQVCVMHLLSRECLAGLRVNRGLACGLRHVYHPHGLPPCISTSGSLLFDADSA